MKKIVLVLTFCLSFISILLAQPPKGMPPGMSFNIGKVYGKILDKVSKKPLAYASVTVSMPLGARDSIINGNLSQENGDFSIEGLPMGKFTVKISFLGYQEYSQKVFISMPDNLELDLGNIGLVEEEVKSGDVVITAEKSTVAIGIDKRVFNVGKNITATGGTAEDVLKSVPSVTVDGDGGAQLRNNAATVYMDGRPTQLSLNQIPADMIEQVEVMTNPSAKYEAGITGGMINIVMKKNRKPGYNGFVSLGAGTGNRYNTTANLNIKQGKWNFTTFYTFSKNGFPVQGYTRRTTLSEGIATSTFSQDNASNFNNLNQVARLGIDYSINNRNTLTVAGNWVNGRFNVGDTQTFDYVDRYPYNSYSGARTITPDNHFDTYMAQGTWKKQFPKKGKELIADFTYGWGSSENHSEWVTKYNEKNGVTAPNDYQNVDGGSNGKQYTFQSDFVNPINDSARIEMGVRSFTEIRSQNMIMTAQNPSTGEFQVVPFISNDINIQNYINAAYINYASKWKSIGYQVGLRYEQSNFIAKSNLSDSTFGYNYPKDGKDIWRGLFPALYLSKKFNEKTELQFNVSRKINRPGFMQVLPIIFMADRQNLRMGNPLLQPEFINTAEVNFSKMFGNSNLLSSVYYRIKENPIVNYVYTSPQDSTVLINTFTNGQTVSEYGIDNTFKTSIGKSIELSLNANIFKMKVITADITREGWVGNGKAIFNYKFPDSWAIKVKQKPLIKFSTQLTGSYESRQIIPQGYRKAIPTADFALKAELSKLASLTFSVNDMTNTRRMIWVYDMPTYTQEMMRRRDTRNFKVALQFMFGKPDASIFKKGKNMQKMQQQGGSMEGGY